MYNLVEYHAFVERHRVAFENGWENLNLLRYGEALLMYDKTEKMKHFNQPPM